jgi:2,4-diketo-3-deoxy-L-fuconate hydrolase
MKLYTFEANGRELAGVQLGDRLLSVTDVQQFLMESGAIQPPREQAPMTVHADLLGLIWAGEAGRDALGNALGFARENPDVIEAEHFLHTLAEVKLRAPIPRPGKILCSGLNYRSHVEENPNAKFLEDPRFFAKLPNTVIGPGEAIRHPGERYQVDYEVELAVVIGRPMPRGTPAERVLEHIFGYTILHDVSARYIQFKDNNEMMGKNFDTFCPLGPCLVTADEVPHPEKLRLRTLLNGQVMQDRTNADWCFPLPRLLEWLSSAMTLEPGDIVSTGTPAGIGWFRNPQVFLKPGDVCRLEIEGIGILENPVVAEREIEN